MQIYSRNGALFELRGHGSFVTLRCWCNGEWVVLATVGNHTPGWRILDEVMEGISLEKEEQLEEATNA
jgi:hypothetical protein